MTIALKSFIVKSPCTKVKLDGTSIIVATAMVYSSALHTKQLFFVNVLKFKFCYTDIILIQMFNGFKKIFG